MFQRLQFLKGEHVHGLQRFHASLDCLEFALKNLQPFKSHRLRDLWTWVWQCFRHFLEANCSAALFLD